MAISEVNALLDLLGKATGLVSTVRDNYRRTPLMVQNFTESVAKYEKDVEEWKRLLRKYPLPQDHPVEKRLEEAVTQLQKQVDAVRAMDASNCCVRFWKKAMSPEDLIPSLQEVDKAFQEILVPLEGKKEIELRLQEAVEKHPFSFTQDKNYVPVMETVEKVRKALQGDGSSHVQKVVLVYGASGEGKSTLAKFLAWDYYKRSKVASSSSDLCRFSDGVVFISCKEKTGSDSLFLLRKLLVDLGYSPEASQVRGVQSDGKDTRALTEIDLDYMKRNLISLLHGKSILIILDDVSDRQVIEDLMIQLEDVSYLITSQQRNIWSSPPDQVVRIGTPTTKEARQILANHIAGWNGKPFPSEVQGEVDHLLEGVQNHPLVIANLASRIKFDHVSKLRKWIQVRTQLKNALQAAEKDQSVTNVTMMFNTSYKQSAIASLTMAVDQILEKPRSLLLLLALCTGNGVPENVLTLWFTGLYGVDMFSFEDALDDLQARCLLLITETTKEWSNDPLKVYSIHDLRRQLLPEMYKKTVEDMLKKLFQRGGSIGYKEELVSSRETEEDLIAALFYIYGDEKYMHNADNGLKIHDDLLQSDSRFRLTRSYWLKFAKTMAQLLQQNLEDASEEEEIAHGLAKTVILHFLQSAELKDYPVSELLKDPDSRTFLVTCSALYSLSFCYLSEAIPMTIRDLANPLRKWAHEPMMVVHHRLHSCLKAISIGKLSLLFAVAKDLPVLLIKLLQWSCSNSSECITIHDIALTLLSYLYVWSHLKIIRVQLAEAPGMLEVLLGLLNPNLNPNQTILEYTSRAFRMFACSDPKIKAKTILLPDVFSVLVHMLPLVPTYTLDSLTELAWTPITADFVASHPGALSEIVLLLGTERSSNTQSKAILCIGRLGSFSSTRTIIASACPSAFRRLIQLLTQDGLSVLFKGIAIAVCDIVSDDIGFKFETSENFLTDILQKLYLLLGENIHVTVRSHAVEAIEILASRQSVCKCLGVHPGLLEHIFRILAFPDTTVECVEIVNNAVKQIFIEGKGLAESRKMALVAGAVEMYTSLIQDEKAESGLHRKVAKGLASICCRPEFCLLVAEAGADLEQILQIHMQKDPTFYNSVEGAQVVEDIFLERTRFSGVRSAVLVSEVVRFYMNFLRGGHGVQPHENAVQAIAVLAYWREIRQLIIDRDTVELLWGHVTERASPLVLICVAQIIYRVCGIEGDACQRVSLLSGTLRRYATLLTERTDKEVTDAAMEGLLIVASKKESQELLLADQSTLDLLLGLVREDSSKSTLQRVAYLFQNILAKGSEQEEVRRIVFMDRVLESFIGLLGDEIPTSTQAAALGALGRLAFRQENGGITVASPRALNLLTQLVRKVDFRSMLSEVGEVLQLVSVCQMDAENSQEDMFGVRSYGIHCFLSVMESDAKMELRQQAAQCLAHLLRYQTNCEIFTSTFPSGIGCLSECRDEESSLSEWSMEAFTLIDPIRAAEMNLSSIHPLEGRIWGRIFLKQYKSALEDCDRAVELSLVNCDRAVELSLVNIRQRLLAIRSFIKFQLGDKEGALEDLRDTREPLGLQERGILKSLMLDYEGAMLDLNDSLRLGPDDYEVLKHRGYVKFCLGDEDGARFDAEQAICTRFRRCTFPSLNISSCLGVSPVKYLDYNL